MKRNRKHSFVNKLLAVAIAILLVAPTFIFAAEPGLLQEAGNPSASSAVDSEVSPTASPSPEFPPTTPELPDLDPSTEPSIGPITGAKPDDTVKPGASTGPNASAKPNASLAPNGSASPTPSASPSISPSPTAEVRADGTVDPADGMAQFGLNTKIYVYDADNNLKPLNNGDTVPRNSKFSLQSTFAISEAQVLGIDAAHEKATTKPPQYKVDFTHQFVIASLGASAPLIVKDVDGTEIQFGTLLYDSSSSNLAVTFQNKLEDIAPFIEKGELHFDCTLNNTTIGNAKEIEITLAGVTLKLKIEENQDKPASLQKTAQMNGNVCNWTVTYDPKSDTSTNPMTFTDNLPSEVVYVPNSFKIGGNPTPPNYVDNTLSAEFTPTPGTTTEITFSTVLSDAAIGEGGKSETVVKNKAQVKKTDGTGTPIESNESTAKYPISAKTWAIKDGKYVGIDATTGNRQIEWTITINTLERNLKNLTLYDMVSSENAAPPTDIGNITFSSGSPSVAFLPAGTIGSKPYTFGLKFKDSPLADSYTITYYTTIPSDAFDPSENPDNQNFENDAWLDFDWYHYGTINDGPYDFRGPELHKTVGINPNIITKKATAYDHATKTITWSVEVNPHKTTLANGTIRDVLNASPNNDNGQVLKYVGGSFSPSNASQLTLDSSTNENQLIIDVTNVDTGNPTFTFKTKVLNPSTFPGNQENTDYNNTITMTTGSITTSAKAKQSIPSKILTKAGTKYDPNTKKIIWTITLNEYNLDLKNVQLIDDLSKIVDGSTTPCLKYDDGSAAMDGTVIDPSKVDNTNGILTLSLGNITDKKVVTFTTTVDTDSYAGFKENTKVKIENSIKIKTTSYTEETSASGQIEITNKALSKADIKPGVNFGNSSVSYVVNLNQNRVQISRDNKNDVITDFLPSSLRVDRNSVSLYNANVNSDGTFTQGTPADTSLYDVTYSAEKNSFTLTFKNPTNECYQLHYTADIVTNKSEDVKNNIVFGTDKGANTEDSSFASFRLNAGGGGGLTSRKVRLALTKADSADPTKKLKGVVFAIAKADNPTDYLDYGETDDNGELIFSTLAKNTEYIITEISAPEGYQSTDSIHHTTGNQFTKETVEIKNTKITADIEFDKVNDWGWKLQGAEFKLAYASGPFHISDRKATSDANGKVVFEDVPFGEYTIAETVAPVNHALSTETITAIISEQGKFILVNKTGTPLNEKGQFVNTADTASIEITKTNAKTNEIMAGVDFTVFDSNGIERGKATTDSDGKCEFINLIVGETYTVHETKVSGFYAEADKEIKLEAAGGSLSFQNRPIPPGSLVIQKLDSVTQKPMEGVTFTVLNSSGTQVATGKTDAQGEVSFTGLRAGTYTLRETTPAGYLPGEDRKVELKAGEQLEIQWLNTPISTPSPTPTASPSPSPTPPPSPSASPTVKPTATPAPGVTPSPTPGTTPSPSPVPPASPSPTPGSGGNNEGNNGNNGNTGGTGGNGSNGGNGGTGNNGSAGGKLPQTGTNQVLPLLALGGGTLLALGSLGLSKNKRKPSKGRHARKE